MVRRLRIMSCVLMFPALILLSSCTETRAIKPVPIPTTENPADHVNKLDSDLSSGRKNQLNVLVPDAFAKAERYLDNAKSALQRRGEISEILDNVSRGRASLKLAEDNVSGVRAVLSDVIEARRLARVAGATRFEAYAPLEEEFLDLTVSLERGNAAWAQANKKNVAGKFRELELRAIKEKTLSDVRESLVLAEKAGARKIVPITFALAENKLREVDRFISEQRYQTETIHSKAEEALFIAQRLNQIMRQAEKVQLMKPEDISLFIEGILQEITAKLAAADMRNEDLNVQVENILASISALQEDRQFMVEKTKAQQSQISEMTEKHETEVSHLSRQIALLEGKTKEEQADKERLEAEKRSVEERLSAERRFSALYGEVQNFFAPDEAEVYKQGYQLVIRLKKMKFPVGAATIMPESFQLLSKVQRAIRTFGEPDVVIEGHTDSTGTAVVNELLSQQRAEAVREYLVANRTLMAEKILALGYGSERPLASNATPEGRAINRRIDVIIKPEVIEGTAFGTQ